MDPDVHSGWKFPQSTGHVFLQNGRWFSHLGNLQTSMFGSKNQRAVVCEPNPQKQEFDGFKYTSFDKYHVLKCSILLTSLTLFLLALWDMLGLVCTVLHMLENFSSWIFSLAWVQKEARALVIISTDHRTIIPNLKEYLTRDFINTLFWKYKNQRPIKIWEYHVNTRWVWYSFTW